MKKFQSLARSLTRDEQMKVLGGVANAYNCTITYIDGSTEDVSVNADSLQEARVLCRGAHQDIDNSTCTLA